MTINVTPDMLRSIAGNRGPDQWAIIVAIAPLITSLAPAHAIDSPLRMAHFLGQSCEESAGFDTMHEYASGAAYEGRHDLGNTQPGDGIRYKGRGLIETTGRGNYRAFTEWCRENGYPEAPDFEANPTALEDPKWAVLSAICYWETPTATTTRIMMMSLA